VKPKEQTAARFDKEAATWDDNPDRQQLTAAIAAGIRSAVPLRSDQRLLEYGCGTASLSFLLAESVGQVVAADISAGMIEQVRRKLAGRPKANLTPMLLDLSSQSPLGERFDVIVTAMAMHHIVDTTAVLSRLVAMLANGGWLAVADLCLEDGSFHDHLNVQVPHNGLDPDGLAEVVRGLGLSNCRWQVVHRIEKNGRSYDVFLLTARRV
jgi:2-polyprenyl-3-methyl-5-hydroxy-6-metoxy-1,4-benzoquinol methylase